MQESADLTGLLNNWMQGDDQALEELAPLVYQQLQRLARRAFAGESGNDTLQPTILVNEVFLNLVDADVDWKSRTHFYALSARMMRRLLINHAQERNAMKRGGGQKRVEFLEEQIGDNRGQAHFADLFALNEALEDLSRLDDRKAELIELQYFAGLSFREMEEVTGLSSSSLDRELRFSRAWLNNRLGNESQE